MHTFSKTVSTLSSAAYVIYLSNEDTFGNFTLYRRNAYFQKVLTLFRASHVISRVIIRFAMDSTA